MAFAGAATVCAWWCVGRKSEPVPVVRMPLQSTVAAAPIPPLRLNVAGPASTPVPEPPAPPQAREIAGTWKMYLAHAPLREPEVANPDSESNRKILETMVIKALKKSGASPFQPPLVAR